jgi:hypothetical protein
MGRRPLFGQFQKCCSQQFARRQSLKTVDAKGTETVQFSPKEEFEQTLEAVGKNLDAMGET